MKNIILSLSLTVLLGPGVGHIYLRKFKKAIILILATLAAAIHLAWVASKKISTIPGINTDNITNHLMNFTNNNPKLMLPYDIVFAALWAYALVDVFMEAKKMMPKKPDTDEDNTPQ